MVLNIEKSCKVVLSMYRKEKQNILSLSVKKVPRFSPFWIWMNFEQNTQGLEPKVSKPRNSRYKPLKPLLIYVQTVHEIE